MKTLVVGATGKYAGLVVPELKRRGAKVCALIRSGAQADEARGRGADEFVVGDLRDPASLRAALAGVDGVFHLNPAFSPDEAELGVGMVKAARSAGVEKFVFSGAIHPSISAMTNHAAKRPVEEALYESGLDFTVLQPTMFMQTFADSWLATLDQGRFGLPYSKTAKASYVDYRDIAEAAAIALTTDRLNHGTFELCAPGMFSREEVTSMMSEALGRTIEAGEPPFNSWAEFAKVPEGPVQDGLRRMYAHYDQHGFPGGNALVLRAILDREPRTLREFFQELVQRDSVKKV